MSNIDTIREFKRENNIPENSQLLTFGLWCRNGYKLNGVQEPYFVPMRKKAKGRWMNVKEKMYSSEQVVKI